MARSAAVASMVVGVAALALAAIFAGPGVLASYLAAWLFGIGIPAGALGVLMVLEILGTAETPIAGALRATLILLPVLALLSVPILIGAPGLYPLGGFWMSSNLIVVRAVVILVIWTLLALIFLRPARRPGGARLAAAVAGLMVYLVTATIAATDWVQSLTPDFGSSAFGLLLILSQCSLAVAVAVLLGLATRRGIEAGASAATLLACLLGAWLFLHFTQFLIVWSANLPKEVVWYQRRGAGLGHVAEWIAAAACGLALLLMLPRRLERLRATLAVSATLVVAAHVIEAFWLVTPTARGALSITGGDALVLAGILCLLLGPVLLFSRRRGIAHGAP